MGNTFESAASQLESIGEKQTSDAVNLGLKKPKTATAESKQGISHMAKSVYEQAGYSKDKAMKAALLLSAAFIRATEESNPKIRVGYTLEVNDDHAILQRGEETIRVEFVEELALEEKREKEHVQVVERAHEQEAQLIESVESGVQEFSNLMTNLPKVQQLLGYKALEEGADQPIITTYRANLLNQSRDYIGYSFYGVTAVHITPPEARKRGADRYEEQEITRMDGTVGTVTIKVEGELEPSHTYGYGGDSWPEVYVGYNPKTKKYILIEKEDSGMLKEHGESGSRRGIEGLMKNFGETFRGRVTAKKEIEEERMGRTVENVERTGPRTGSLERTKKAPESFRAQIDSLIEGKGSVVENVSNPFFKMEAYHISMDDGRKYYLAAQKGKKPTRYKLNEKSMRGRVKVNWTENLDAIKDEIKLEGDFDNIA
jgi:hypothetical protein